MLMESEPDDNLDDGSFNLRKQLEANLTNKKYFERIATLNISSLPQAEIFKAKEQKDIKDLIDITDDINELRIRIHGVNLSIQVESFGISWEGPSRQKKKTKMASKEINRLLQEQQE